MSKPIVRIHNIETNEVIDREMTDIEFANYQAKLNKQIQTEAEAQAKATAKSALLVKLGITEDEAKLLLA
jgi:lipoate synthase